MFHNSDDADGKQSITFTPDEIKSARRLLRRLVGEERPAGLRYSAFKFPDRSRDALIARASRDFANRHRRTSIFGGSMFGEAAWDMLLALYILERSDQRQTVGALMQHAGAPTTTAKRWLDFLEGRGLVARTPHPTDRRTAFVSLTQNGRSKLDLFYSETADVAL